MASDIINEEWRIVTRFPNYEVSNFGHVRRAVDCYGTYKGKKRKSPRFFAGRIISSTSLQSRHLTVKLWRDGDKRGTTEYVHILVCEAFLGPKPSSRHLAAHWNGDPSDNNVENLRWATPSENNEDTIRHGRSNIGRRVDTSKKLSKNDIPTIRELLREGVSHSRISTKFGCTRENITHIANGRSWAGIP